MVRMLFVAACAWSCLAASTWAQGQPATTATPSATTVKPAVKKPAPKARTSAKSAGAADSGPCQVGVISVIGDEFVVQRVGLTMFGNEYTEVPIESWSIDDLVVARVRAALPNAVVKRIAYPKGAFTPYDHPAPALFRNAQDDLTAIVRPITANAGCGRYVVVTKLTGKIDGTNQTHRGIGVLNRGIGTGALSHTSLFTDFDVSLFDGQTFAAHKMTFNVDGSLKMALLGEWGRDPISRLENDAFPEPATAAAASAMLRDHTRALLTAVLDKKLAASLKEE
jgi:hypothetical protein